MMTVIGSKGRAVRTARPTELIGTGRTRLIAPRQPYRSCCLAFSNIRIHGLRSLRSPDVQLICTFRNTRSGCGINAV